MATTLIRDGDADAVGEILRSIIFPYPGFGGYETFALHPDAQTWNKEMVAKFWEEEILMESEVWLEEDEYDSWKTEPDESILATGEGCTLAIDDILIQASWFQDGDGILAFSVSNIENQPIRAVINTDCKKNYGWEDSEFYSSS
jgi:hypothetical protein